MKRKRAARKKSVAKKPTPSVNVDEQLFINFVANSVVDEINNNKQSDQVNVGKDFRHSSSSSSSSSDNDGSFHLEIYSSRPDEPAIITKKKEGETSTVAKKKRLVSKHGSQKKGATSRKTTNASVMPPRGLVPNVTQSMGSGSKVMPSKGLRRKKSPSPKISSQDPRYNKLELKTSLAVIKKVMSMDEAGPFNAPVDPVSQGLPDYFTVIDTPMDFGTICSNLQNGVKYMNSGDVYKDVNYIWENCCNYNKKGDYIVYLMKRVKKKFLSYWKSAGLCTEIPREHSGDSHSMPSSDHAMWQSRHEALSVVNRMVTNSNRMQQDKVCTSQPQPQVILSGNVQPYQSRHPQPSTTQVPLFSQLHADEGSSDTDQHSLETCVQDIEDLRHTDSTPNIVKQLQQNKNEGIGSMAKYLEMRKRQSLETCVQDIEDLRYTDSTPNVDKQLQQKKNEGTGSMAKFLEMRKLQTGIGEQSKERMDASETQPEVPLTLPNAIEGIGQTKTKGYRGRAKHDAIQTRNFGDRKIVNLNKNKQPTAADDKTLKMRLRKRQSGIGEQSEERIDASETQPKVQLALPNAIEVIGQDKTKRNRGQTKLDAIHSKKFEDRKIVNLDKDKQTTAANDKTLTMRKRKRQSGIGEQSEERMDASKTQLKVPLALPNAIEGIGQAKTKRCRGQTKLEAIQTRKFEDRKIVNLNKDKQPTAADDKTLKMRLRKHQSGIGEQSEERMDASEKQPEVQLALPDAIEGIGQAKTRRCRGQTKLDAIPIRKFEDRKIVNLNKDKQPTAADDKTLKMRLRKRQSGIGEQSEERMDASETQVEVQLAVPNATEGIGQAKKRRCRGQTRLDAIHSRKFEDRKIINLNEDKQPTAADDKTLIEFSNFLGSVARRYVRLDHINWHKVPCKDQLWNLVQEKYVISEDGRPWVMTTISGAWRVYKSRIKKKHYTAYDNDDERRKNRPDFLSDEQFETLLQFWNDDKVKKIAETNSTIRKQLKDLHTCGPVGFARIRKKLQLEKPNQAEPSKAELFVATRKRNADGATQDKIAIIEEKLLSGEENMDEILGEKSHGRSWLVGRIGQFKSSASASASTSAATRKANISEEALQQIKAEVRNEVKEEMEKAMQAQLANMMQRLGQMNPTLNLNLDVVVGSPDTTTDASDAH
ncbi:uncharacterized protein [Euphorbia lathyris]|uniref:uncharacterized protein n=1 Tax=Euphorbia lathyris TaxID=212925 RepID=UPI0033141E64